MLVKLRASVEPSRTEITRVGFIVVVSFEMGFEIEDGSATQFALFWFVSPKPTIHAFRETFLKFEHV